MRNLKFKATKVVCLDYNKVYESIQLAHRLTGCCERSIRKCCKGILKGCYNKYGGKLRWMYYDDYIREHGEESVNNLHSTSKDFY